MNTNLPVEILHFSDLSAQQLFEIYKLRSVVFVVEQNCAYQDVDDKDTDAWHVMFAEEDVLIAYGRLLAPGISYQEASIGRVVVDYAHRGRGLGRDLMQCCITFLRDKFPGEDIVISAQSYLSDFYASMGFEPEGAGYLEDHIPHVQMRLKSGRSTSVSVTDPEPSDND